MTTTDNIPESAFVCVRQVQAEISPSLRQQEPLTTAELECQKGGRRRRAIDCLRCEKFIAWQVGPTPDRLTVHCRWSSTDPVSDLMTRGEALVTVAPRTTLVDAAELAERTGVRHLPVVAEDGDLVGILCRCDLAGPRSADVTVVSQLCSPVLALSPTSTIGEALMMMREFEVGCVPVVEDGRLRGMVTRGDLRRAGVPEELLGARRCAACGSPHGVRTDPRCECVDFCLDCIERAYRLDGEVVEGELGGGD